VTLQARDSRPNPSAPVQCRVRLRYAKRGTARFTSHRDVARAFERALRRAAAPVAYSQGFSPHPKISWLGAAPTGAASEAEYVEIGLTCVVDPEEFGFAVGTALPAGLAVVDCVLANTGGFSERIDASSWRIELPGMGEGPVLARLRAAVEGVLAAERVEVRRLTKKGVRIVDVRPCLVRLAVVAPDVSGASLPASAQVGEPRALGSSTAARPTGAEVSAPGGSCGILEAVVRQATPTVRPDDVLSALRVVAELEPPLPARATRMAQGRLDDASRLADPLGPDRAGVSVVAAGEQEPQSVRR
jgi:radical SAM-linked protein